MKLLIAVDSAISTDVLVAAVGIRPWPDGTTAHVLSIVADMDVPEEVWHERKPKEAILKDAANWGADLIVVSSHWRRVRKDVTEHGPTSRHLTPPRIQSHINWRASTVWPSRYVECRRLKYDRLPAVVRGTTMRHQVSARHDP